MKSNRGFAGMDPKRRAEISSKGGKAAHAKGTAHEFTSEEARAAGRAGGEAVSRDREHMKEIGRLGGASRGKQRKSYAASKVEVAKTGEPFDVNSSFPSDTKGIES